MPCPAGEYTDTPGQASCTPCDPGYTCSEGSTSPRPSDDLCPLGYYCTDGRTATACPAGKICCRLQLKFTFVAVFTKLNDSHNIPAEKLFSMVLSMNLTGTYGNTTGASSAQQGCQVCPQGWYCPEGTAGLPTQILFCPRGHYCPAGTERYRQYPCPVGTYNSDLGAVREADCLPCPAGSFCAGTAENDIFSLLVSVPVLMKCQCFRAVIEATESDQK